jgi:hypothetical protein
MTKLHANVKAASALRLPRSSPSGPVRMLRRPVTFSAKGALARHAEAYGARLLQLRKAERSKVEQVERPVCSTTTSLLGSGVEWSAGTAVKAGGAEFSLNWPPFVGPRVVEFKA